MANASPNPSAMATGESVQLLSVAISPYSLRAELALKLKGVNYENLPQNLRDKSELLLKSNPVHKKVPVLIHNGRPVCESTVIVQYVDEAWPSLQGHDLLPKDPYDRSVTRFWAEYADRKLFDALFGIIKTKGEEQKTAINNAMECLATLEEALGAVASESPFFGGLNMGYVDVIMGPLVSWFDAFEVAGEFKFPIQEKFPRLHAWFKAVKSSPTGSLLPEPEKVTDFAIQVLRKRFVS